MRRLLCKLFGHFWRTTHVNRHGLPTGRQCCLCGVAHHWEGGPWGAWKPGE